MCCDIDTGRRASSRNARVCTLVRRCIYVWRVCMSHGRAPLLLLLLQYLSRCSSHANQGGLRKAARIRWALLRAAVPRRPHAPSPLASTQVELLSWARG
jgi:hypothetical protein